VSLEFLQFWHTVRWLRPVQVWARLWLRLYRPRPDHRLGPPVRPAEARWTSCTLAASMSGPTRFRFLNVEHQLDTKADWNRADWPKLWLYNLHYFDDLTADGAVQRVAWHRALIDRWIDENPPGEGNGWEPYPVSLRLVNWIKWALHGNKLDPKVIQSMAVQSRWLRQRLEIHLLGNHLLANAKALIFSGTFFESIEASTWRQTGLSILRRELRDQVLDDGGHVERSPMYHAIVLEDLLDLLQLAVVFPNLLVSSDVAVWRNTATDMLNWLKVMTHPDGGIAFFNDATFNIAPTYAQLCEYARGLEVDLPSDEYKFIEARPETGYFRLQMGPAVLIADVGAIGPDYIPGHAHADTLSFELSWYGRRVFTNSGTSTYEIGSERSWERATSAHNTVSVDQADSSEVWSAFRVARRARPFEVRAFQKNKALVLGGSHDGYRRLSGRPVHRRQIELKHSELLIHDRVTGNGRHSIAGYLHLHPDVKIERISEYSIRLLLPEVELMLSCTDGALDIEEGRYCLEFGKCLPRSVVVWRRSGHLPLNSKVNIVEIG
jgi:uncharacterized heparinase superfamily protein